MPQVRPSGTEGYGAEADALFQQYESVPFAEIHRHVLPLLPKPPARLLDIGAGTGRDAAGFAALGYQVTAIEPTPELRSRAAALHASPDIDWIDDCLPDLSQLVERGEHFHVVMLTAVWMHLDEAQRRRAMPRVASLMRPGGVMALSLRHGPVPPGRRMFDVTPAETILLAKRWGLVCVDERHSDDGLLKRPDVTWDRLIFVKPMVTDATAGALSFVP